MKANARMSAADSEVTMAKRQRSVFEEVAIDFGTAYTKTAFTVGKLRERYAPSFPDSPASSDEVATRTCLLAKKVGVGLELVAFGKEADQRWKDMQLDQDRAGSHFFFSDFKLSLCHDNLQRAKDSGKDPTTKASDGSDHPLKRVLTLAFSAITQAVHARIGHLNKDFTENSIKTYNLTMPALWCHDAQKLMREAFCEAIGVDADRGFEKLKMVYEPEAAAVNWSYENNKLKKKDIVTVVDMGGGTVDLSTLSVTGFSKEKSANKVPFFKTEVTPSGGLWGSKSVDDKFLQEFVKSLVSSNFVPDGQNCFEAFVGSHEGLEVMESFEMAKKAFDPSQPEYRTAVKFSPLISFLRSKGHTGIELGALVDNYNQSQGPVDTCIIKIRGNFDILFKNKHMLGFFEDTFRCIMDAIKVHIDRTSHASEAAHYLVLAGGFSESRLLRSKICERLRDRIDVKLQEFQRPQIAIVDGALKMATEDFIKTRKLKRTYGTEVVEEYDAANDLHSYILRSFPHAKKKMKIYKTDDGCMDVPTDTEVITGIFEPWEGLRRGDDVSRSLEYIHNVHSFEVGTKDISAELYITEKDNPRCIFEPGMQRFGTVSHPLSGKKRIENFEILLRPGMTEPTVCIFPCEGRRTRESRSATAGLPGRAAQIHAPTDEIQLGWEKM